MPKNWNRRFKHNRDKIKTGDIYELAEVVRNLSLRESEKGLSTGEKQMFTRSKKILASELMYALDKDEEEAENYLDELLANSATSQMAVRRGRVARLRAVDADRCRRAAASVSGRMRPKALVELAGRPLVQWSVDALRAVAAIEQIVVALPVGADAPVGTSGVQGGAVRSESVRLALAAAGGGRDQDLVLVHDAARPLLTTELASATIRRSRS